MRRFTAGLLVLVGAGLAGCSSDADSGTTTAASASAADVCRSADALRASLTALGDVHVAQNGTAALQEAWTTMLDDWGQLKKAAAERYSDQIDGVQADADAVRSAVETAQQNPSGNALAQAASAVGLFVQDAGARVKDVSSAC